LGRDQKERFAEKTGEKGEKRGHGWGERATIAKPQSPIGGR